MSRLWAKLTGLLSSSKNLVGVDKAGNRYFKRTEELDGIMKEKRWVTFKGEVDSTSIPGITPFSLMLICHLRETIGKEQLAAGINFPCYTTTSLFAIKELLLIDVVEWICWLNGQRKSAPTPEEMAELEARREFVKLNVARLKKEEEERMAKEGKIKATSIGKADRPDLKSFVQQFPDASEGDKAPKASDTQNERSSEPTGSGESFRPGAWQPPT